MTPPKKHRTNARNVHPIREQESAPNHGLGTDPTGQFGYNQNDSPNQPDSVPFREGETRRGRSPGARDVTVQVPAPPPVISPQAGRVLLRILLDAAQDSACDGTERKAA
jgi:hypothetical protein